jgi:hypothetical protein
VAHGGEVRDVKQLKFSVPHILKNRKSFTTFVVGGWRLTLAPRPAPFSAMKHRGNGRLFEAAMTTTA